MLWSARCIEIKVLIQKLCHPIVEGRSITGKQDEVGKWSKNAPFLSTFMSKSLHIEVVRWSRKETKYVHIVIE